MWIPCLELWRDGGSCPLMNLDAPYFVRDCVRLVVGGWMEKAEPLHLQTRKKVSENVKMTRNVGEGEVGVAVCSAEEKGSDEAHDGRVPGATRPDIHNRHVVSMNDNVLTPEMVRPSEEGAKKCKEFPEVDVEGPIAREPWDAVKAGDGQREPAVAEDSTQAKR